MTNFFRALAIGLISAIAVYFTILFNMPTWVLFITWVSFHVFGQTFRSILHTCIQIFLGIGIAVLISITGQSLSMSFGTLSLPISVMLVITFFVSGVHKLKPLTAIPAYFKGIIIFFGINQPATVNNLFLMAVTVISGFFFAWLAEFLCKIITDKMEPKDVVNFDNY
ncbi:DUF1097 domain-containing protein [Chryseobacterium gleum]|uniref:DUF1097 domain-containing protein n=1 Tax=Chryseobacterium TaxID=59732 RepID=UPI0028AF68B3|nr:DUF1097 domain-containing protein [Chryseobacterium gleum]